MTIIRILLRRLRILIPLLLLRLLLLLVLAAFDFEGGGGFLNAVGPRAAGTSGSAPPLRRGDIPHPQGTSRSNSINISIINIGITTYGNNPSTVLTHQPTFGAAGVLVFSGAKRLHPKRQLQPLLQSLLLTYLPTFGRGADDEHPNTLLYMSSIASV